MAPRTRQQQELEKQALVAASHVWTRVELLLLLRAWKAVLRSPNAHRESSEELEFRIYTRMATLCEGEQPAKDAHAIHQQTKHLKRTFRFISEYNQSHIATADVPESQPEPRKLPWFALSSQARQEAFQSRKRQRQYRQKQHTRAHSFVDIDEYTYQELAVIMKLTVQQIKKRSATVPSSSSLSAAVVEPSPWTSAELWKLLYAWGDVLEEMIAESASVTTDSAHFQARLYLRFASLSGEEASSCRDEMSCRLQKKALVSLYYLVASYNDMRGIEKDWFSLSVAEKERVFALWNHKAEGFEVLDRGMFSMLAYLVKQEGGRDWQSQQQVDTPYSRSAREAKQTKLEAASQGFNEIEAKHPLQSGDIQLNGDAIIVDLVSDAADDSDDNQDDCTETTAFPPAYVDYDNQLHPRAYLHESGRKAQAARKPKSLTLWSSADFEIESTTTSASRSSNQENQSMSGHGGYEENDAINLAAEDSTVDAEAELSAATPQKRKRMDPELLAIIDILEKQAQNLSWMLRQAREDRTFDLEERKKILEQLKADQESRRQERLIWELEREEMKRELAELRKQVLMRR
ncbi:hypothetical protein FI667_g17331, partial [Globisporangium splendens]